VPLRFVLPFAAVVLPGLGGRDGELGDERAVRQLLGFGVPADESDDGELIEVHVLSFFLPDFSGHSEASGGCSQTKEVLSTGDRKNFHLGFRQAIRNEIVVVVPPKAERTPVPGAGFSPEAVPEKGGANEEGTEPIGRPIQVKAECRSQLRGVQQLLSVLPRHE
jgi:hypothetical protein